MLSELLELRALWRNRRLPEEELRRLQERKLQTVVRHAFDNVPFYSDLYRAAGIRPEDIRTLDDLRLLPVVTKQQMRAAGMERLLARGVDRSACLTRTTSGTTGEPFTVLFTPADWRRRRLVDFRTLLAIGFRPLDRLAIMGPEHPFAERLHNRLGLYRTRVIHGALPVERQIEELRAFRPTILWSYPWPLWVLAQRVRYKLSKVVRPRALITSAQVFDPVLRERLLADRHMEVFNLYGAIETGRIAAECPAHRGLHVNADYVVLECLAGDRPAPSGQPGTVVVTSLDLFAMPFIRYKLGDRCALLDGRCSCGSTFPLIAAPEGRDNDLLRLPGGTLVSPLGVSFLLRGFPDVDRFRVVQETVNRVALYVIASRPWPEESVGRLRARLLELLGGPMELEIRLVDSIPEDGLKYKTFVSRLPKEMLQ